MTGMSAHLARPAHLAVLAGAAWLLVVSTMIAIGALWHPGYPAGWLPPFHARVGAPRHGVWAAAGLAVAAVWLLPRLAERIRWRWLLATTVAASAAWAFVLAASNGLAAVSAPLGRQTEYLAALPAVGDSPLAWLRGFSASVGDPALHLPTHVAGHPPLAVLIFWLLAEIGMPGPAWAAALCIVVGASSTAALLITFRTFAGEARARAVAPFLALAPFALTIATSADALFLGVSAWAIAALTIAAVRRSVALGVLAGVLLGCTGYLSYGLVVVGAIAVAVFVLARSRWAALGAGIGILAVVVAFGIGGFWWWDGVQATAARWSAGAGSDRPYAFTVFGNLAVLAVMVGPAAAGAVGWLRDRATRLLVGSAALAALSLDVSGVTRGEVERIWLPLAPWLVLSCSALPRRWARPALIVQAAVALTVQALVRLAW
jgi:hypothetical protein